MRGLVVYCFGTRWPDCIVELAKTEVSPGVNNGLPKTCQLYFRGVINPAFRQLQGQISLDFMDNQVSGKDFDLPEESRKRTMVSQCGQRRRSYVSRFLGVSSDSWL